MPSGVSFLEQTRPAVRSRPFFVSRKQTNKAADAHRGSARKRGYNVKWDKAAKRFRLKHPLCLGCFAAGGKVTPAALVDHVVPHRGDTEGPAFWCDSNWQTLCKWHHDVVKQQLEYLFDEGKLTEAELRLDSAVAVALTRRLRTSVGADGWPVCR